MFVKSIYKSKSFKEKQIEEGEHGRFGYSISHIIKNRLSVVVLHIKNRILFLHFFFNPLLHFF